LAVERQRPADAVVAIDRMTGLAGGESTAAELSAGVLGLIGDHEQAARSYAQVLAAHPEQVEVWLLWANEMRDSGQARRAIDRLSLLVDEADQDDLFLVAVDGLLNLEANGTPLKVALRRILERLAAGPQKIFLYDVAGDLLDTLGQRTRINPLMEQALVFAGEQRGSMLREMMDRAKADNRKADQIDYGSLLVGLGYDVPPTVLIELGETFLAQERRAEADRAFGRACSLGDYATIRQKVADAYDRALLPAPAQQILAELLITDPDNLALLHRDAGLLEQLGRYEEAFAAYERSLRILLGRTPQYRALASSSAPAGSPRRQRMAANLDEMAQFYDPTIESLIICARTDMLAARVVDLLNERATAEIEASAKIAEGRVLAQFPRLSRLAESVRWVSISLHRPQVADELDRRLLSRFPTDVALRRSALETRLAWGLGDRAARLAADLKISRPLPAIVAHDAASAPARLKAFLEAPGIDPAAAGTLVPLLIMTGQDDSARTVMDRCAAAWKKPAVDSTRTMLLAGVALNDPERTAGWLRRHLEVCGSTPDGDRLNDMISEGLRLAWNTLKPEQRATVLEDLERLAGRYTPRSARLDLLRLRLASRPADNGAARRTALLDAARQLADNEKGLVGMLQWLRPDERAAVLEQAWTAAKPAGKLDLLLAAAGAWTWPIDEATLAAFRRLLESGPAPRLDKFNPYSALVRSNWHRNTSRPEIGPVIADYLVAQLKSEPAVQVAAACSFATAGNSRRSSELAAAAVTALVANRKLETEQQRMIEDLVTCLPHGAGAPAWAGSPGTRPVDDASLIELFIAARYAAHTEQETAALEGLTRVFRRAGTNEAIRRALVDYLDSTRRMSALPGIMEPFLADRSIVQSFEISRIAEAYRLAQRPRDALRVFSQDSGTLSAIRTLELEAMLGRPDRIELILRRFLVTNRAERRFYTPLAARPPSVGGMKEYVVRRNTDAPRSFGVFNLLVPFASAVQELRMLWLTAEPDRRDLPGLCEAILAADRERHALAAVSARLEGWARDQSLHARDLYLLTAMLLAQETRLPPDVAENVRGRLMWVGADQVDALETSARLAVQAGHPEQAAAILRWVHAADLLSARKALDSVGPLRRLDLFLSCVPAGQRAAEFSRMARNWITTPLEEPNDRLDGMILRRLTEGDDTRLAGAALDAAREWLARLPAIAYMPRLHRACAYARLRGGEVNEAAPHIRELMRLCETAYGEQQPLDATAFLPPATQLADAAATAAGLRTLILSGLGDGKLSPTHATRSLVLLGQWCADNHLDAEAARALEAARTTAGDTPCERWLWIIDLARSIRPELAVGMEEQLLRANLLPVMRMSECLDDIERTSGRPRADRLALELHACTDLPAVLERAARQADAEHRPDEAAAIRRRLPAASRPAR
jgi:tetratricopeptide (TPR) repeat protein